MQRTTFLAAVAAAALSVPAAASAQWGTTTHSTSSTDSRTTGSSQSTTTTETRTSGWGNGGIMTETNSITTGTSNSRTNSTTRGMSVTTPSWNPAPTQGSNRNDGAAVAGALIGILGAMADRNAPRVSADDVLGRWAAVDQGRMGAQDCEVELTTEKALLSNGNKFRPHRCWGELGGVYMWVPRDGAVVLYRNGGQQLATLRGDGQRLSGRTPDGRELVLYRQGY